MTSLEYLQARSCKRKVRLDMTSAMDHLHKTLARPDIHRPEAMDIYLCSFCGWLHIGHHPKRKKQKQNEAIKQEIRY